MSSSPAPDPAAAPHRTGFERLVPRSLTTRLVLSTLALVALVSVVVLTVTAFALHQYLINRLDDQLMAATALHTGDADGQLSTGGGLPPMCPSQDSRVAFGEAPGTLIGRFDALCQQAMLTTGHRSSPFRILSADDLTILEGLPFATEPRTVSLSVGEYRVVNEPDGVTGLPTADVSETVSKLVVSEAAIALGGVLLAAVIGQALVRRQLAPLRQVAATATAVTQLPLESGEVGVIERVPAALTDPATEVGQVGAALNSMLGHVEMALDTRHESEQRVRQFLADASHELRTPLATIMGYAELTRRTSADPAALTHAMGRIQAESGRMASLVNDLLLLARLDSGRPLDRADVDVSRLLAEAVNDARVVSPVHRWRLTLPEDPLHVEGDQDRLHQAVSNLLTNAIGHTPEGTTVTVSVVGVPRDDDGPHGVRITVHDDGPGLPQSLVGKEFERFSRGDTSRTRASGGTGLGLSIVHAIVSAHRGTVAIRSSPGDTTIDIRLPHS